MGFALDGRALRLTYVFVAVNCEAPKNNAYLRREGREVTFR